MRYLQRRANSLQETDCEANALLFGSGQAVPPVAEIVGEFDFPGQPYYVMEDIMSSKV